MALDWPDLLMGLVAGGAMGGLYFASLALGIRLALRQRRTTLVLAISSALRIALVLGVGWLIAQSGLTMLVGYGLGFVLARRLAIALARPTPEAA